MKTNTTINTNATTLTVFAEALIDNRRYANERINGTAVGVANAKAWRSTMLQLLDEAYKVAEYNYNHMGDSTVATACNKSAFYAEVKKIIEFIGEVNGYKLLAENIDSMILGNAMKYRKIAISNEAAHAVSELAEARKAFREEETEENEALVEKWAKEVKRLEDLPDNFNSIPTIQTQGTFIKNVEKALGDAIKGQKATPFEVIKAERDAKEAERKAKAKARKQARRQAQAQAKAEAEAQAK